MMQIGELAKLAGCPVVTIRYYEKEGFLPPPKRIANNYRVYDQQTLDRLKFILHCRKHGLSQNAIIELLKIKDKIVSNCDYAHKVIQEQLDKINEELHSLILLKKELSQLNKIKCSRNPNNCPVIQHLTNPALCTFYQPNITTK